MRRKSDHQKTFIKKHKKTFIENIKKRLKTVVFKHFKTFIKKCLKVISGSILMALTFKDGNIVKFLFYTMLVTRWHVPPGKAPKNQKSHLYKRY